MAGVFDIEAHLVFYRKYHFNKTNVAIHLACIPLILLSAICMTIDVSLPVASSYVTLGVAVAWIYGLYYVALDWQLGVPAMAVLTGFGHIQRMQYATLNENKMVLASEYRSIAIGVHVVCWLAQFYGHAVHEKRAPALFDNLLQALVLAPFFVVYEIAFWWGFKLDVQKRMDKAAAAELVKMNAVDNSKHKKVS